MIAHYYVDGALQDLARETGGCVGDSLEMARFGANHPASTLVVAGVRFMGETAKILSPRKRVLMPDGEATCSLDLGCPADAFGRYCDAHPDRTVVVYANTSAAVKARADWVVTSSVGQDIVAHLHARGEKILWAPDRHLGAYIQARTGADMLLWQGSCVVHDEFKADDGRAVARASASGHPGPSRIAGRRRRAGRCGRLHDAADRRRRPARCRHLHRRHRPGHPPRHAATPSGQDLPGRAHRRPWRDLQELRAMSLDGDERAGRRGAGP